MKLHCAGAYYNDLHQFDPDLHSEPWINMSGGVRGSAPSPRANHGFTLIKDKAYIFGGQGVKGYHLHDKCSSTNVATEFKTLPPQSSLPHIIRQFSQTQLIKYFLFVHAVSLRFT
jgi:hypothetical protein